MSRNCQHKIFHDLVAFPRVQPTDESKLSLYKEITDDAIQSLCTFRHDIATVGFSINTLCTANCLHKLQLPWCTIFASFFSLTVQEHEGNWFTWKTPLKLKSGLASFCHRRFKVPSVNGLNCHAINRFLPQFYQNA